MSMKKAIITNNTVDNVIVCSDEGLQGMTFPLGTTVWDCGQYEVQIGDTFDNGVFSRNGVPLEPIKTAEERLAELENMLIALLGGEEDE